MNVAAAKQDLSRSHTHDTTPRIQALQKRSGGAITARIQQRHYNATIRRVEVDIASCQSLSGAAWRSTRMRRHAARLARRHRKRPRYRQLVHFESPSARIARIVQALPGINRNGVLRVAWVIGPCKTYDTRTNEAGELVNVPVGLIVEHAFAKPHNGAHA